MKFKKELQSLNACHEAIRWVDDKSLKEAWSTCERGDWMLWYYFRAKGIDKHLIKAKADCASLVKHLMKDQRSLDALQACYDYVDGKIGMEELEIAAYAAYDATATAATDTTAYAASAARAASAATNASIAADASANAASAAAYAATFAADAAYAAYHAVHDKTLKECANICREVLTKSLFTEKLTNTKT